MKKDAPFVVLNCAQYYHNPELLSSNLFGYAKGSFTELRQISKECWSQQMRRFVFG
ncbi:sigma 54-interacting transcriptional regulator [Lacticaseibacillus paracasei]|uniref:sigma 54-interacting transcriptional regulator n=1 Tax=Lacticaseibacillus paracasei TaxID=1597 RepID=UPI0024782638|nr:sigma 54-interacting transcriptional regulator [Lacticaseibacillus paracasei]MDH7443946.1 sigma 54-interacting transcriptional regulator [Lacticaseibacillus paracasei subsp. paracasei]